MDKKQTKNKDRFDEFEEAWRAWQTEHRLPICKLRSNGSYLQFQEWLFKTKHESDAQVEAVRAYTRSLRKIGIPLN